jgi:LysR family glycine cleavage system transcriptional activator
MRLTPQGAILHEAVSEALDRITIAVARIKKAANKAQLRVTASPSIAAKWLVPRLDGFLALFPSADVRVDVSSQVLDFTRDEVDIALRFGTGHYPGLQAERLFEDTVFPVCSPALLNGKRPLREPRDLLKHTLIHVDWDAQGATWPNWRMWMQASGITDFDETRGLHFGQTSLALQAAIDGQGVALGESSLVADDLASGVLIQPFSLTLRGSAQLAYYLITTPQNDADPMVKAFREWILAEAAQTRLGAVR